MEKQNQLSKLKIPLLIIALVVILSGGGFAIWSITKKEDKKGSTKGGKGGAPVKGRFNATGLYTEEELQHSALLDENSPDLTPQYTAVLMTSSEGIQLIENRMKRIQNNRRDSDELRAKHLVGRTLVNNALFSPQANKAIQKMFDLVDGVIGTDYLTYPVYGKFEEEGPRLRADIDAFLAKGGQGYNFGQKRHGGNAWWFGSVGLNLMYGSNKAHIHSADKIWWGAGGTEMREGLDFFKLVNGHDVPDGRLLVTAFAAWNMYNFVKVWKTAMDFFDKVTRQEAIDALEREGMIRRI